MARFPRQLITRGRVYNFKPRPVPTRKTKPPKHCLLVAATILTFFGWYAFLTLKAILRFAIRIALNLALYPIRLIAWVIFLKMFLYSLFYLIWYYPF